jgi:hypothetical protein
MNWKAQEKLNVFWNVEWSRFCDTKQFTEGAARRPAYTIHVFKYSPHFYNMATPPPMLQTEL